MIPPEVSPENVTTYIVDTGCASVSLARLDGSCAERHPTFVPRIYQVEATIDITWSRRHGKRMYYASYTPSTTPTPFKESPPIGCRILETWVLM